jgi:hypothetical protein
LHSLEEIEENPDRKDDKYGVAIITPIFAELIFVAIILYIFFGSHSDFIGSDYLTTKVTCPLVDRARTVVSSIDVVLLQYNKRNFFDFCEKEDSFQRFFFDAWVRAIVTGTDSTMLVFQALPQAFLFTFVLRHTVVPLFAVMYAFVFHFISLLEERLPRLPSLIALEDFVGCFDVFGSIGSGDWSSQPPRTKNRRRPDTHLMEGWTYRKNKKLRIFRYYYNYTDDTLKWMVWYLLYWVLGFRLGCLWFGLRWPARGFASLMLPTTFGQHEEWFQSASNMVVTEDRVWGLLRYSSAIIQQILGVTPTSVHILFWVVLVIWIVGFLLFLWVCIQLKRGQSMAVAKWIDSDRTKEEQQALPAKKRAGTMDYALELGQPLKLRKTE